MIFAPDFGTLRMCSLLESAAYAAIFATLWFRRREQVFLLHWAMSSVIYALALVAFGNQANASMGSAGLEYGLAALSDLPLLTGMRVFDGKVPLRSWMLAPVAATALAAALPLALAQGPSAGALSDILGSIGLGSCLIIYAIAILRGGQDGGAPRLIVAIAMLAYVPGIIVSVLVQIWGSLSNTVLDLLPILQDQVLLGILNLGLLATPWERALRTLQESALRDSLTGAWNRTALKQRDSALAHPTTSLFLIDIDHFKAINDTHGHATGDAVLVALARRAQALAVERRGMFVRLGGDEFAMVAPTADDQDARMLAERILAMPAPEATGLPPHSLSIGLSRVHADEKTLSHAMARADFSLYRAKASGRDQVAAA